MKSMASKALSVLVGLGCAVMFAASANAAWTDRTIHDEGEAPTYKHNQKSFTGPFDYAPQGYTPRAPRAEAPAPGGRCNTFTFDATKSFDPDNQKLSYLWDFGDGTTSDKPTTTHSYEKAGDYNVTLTVRDNSGMVCDNGLTTTKVSANFPPTCSIGDNKVACLGEAVTFDASGSTGSGALSYKWDFGDGTTGEGATVSHVYEKAGSYRARVMIDDGKGTSCSTGACSVNVSVNDRANVDLTGPEKTCVGRSSNFKAVGNASKYTWDFGDGTTVEGGSSMNHVYQKGGNYTVRVSADNGRGDACSVAADSQNVSVNASPIADAGENTACCVGKTSSFDASKSSHPEGKPLSYSWDFGDGAKAEGAQATHVYEKSGNYRVVLTVKDDSGSDCSMSSDSFVAVVNTSPEAVIEVR